MTSTDTNSHNGRDAVKRAGDAMEANPLAVLAGGAAVGRGVPGIVHGMKSYLMQDEWGQVLEAESISAGLDYPGIGPEHAHLHDIAVHAHPLRFGVPWQIGVRHSGPQLQP